MHFIISHNNLVNVKVAGFVSINILGYWGAKVVNMDWF